VTSKHLERRVFHEPITVRSNDDGTVGIRGYAAVFDYEAHGEVIKPSAFNRTLAQKDDIRLLINHDGVPLARTKSGTLQLGVDDHGLWFDAPTLDRSNPTVQELVSAMSRGDIDQCSFAGWFTDVRREDGVDAVYEVKGADVSVVTYPWYDATETSLTGDRHLDTLALALRSLPLDQRTVVLATIDAEEPEPRTEPAADDDAEERTDAEPVEADEVPVRTYKIADARALLGI
jgi:uncharacterized protein